MALPHPKPQRPLRLVFTMSSCRPASISWIRSNDNLTDVYMRQRGSAYLCGRRFPELIKCRKLHRRVVSRVIGRVDGMEIEKVTFVIGAVLKLGDDVAKVKHSHILKNYSRVCEDLLDGRRGT